MDEPTSGPMTITPELASEITAYGPPMIRILMMPKDTNPQGVIFGGLVLAQVDVAGGEAAIRTARGKVLTRAMREVELVAPVFVGDLVSFYTRVERVGRTSITVRVLVVATRGSGREEHVKVTEAEVVYVAIGADGRPRPVHEEAR